MIIDTKGKIFGKISIVDICVVLIIIIGALGAYFTISTVNGGAISQNSKVVLNSSAPVLEATITFELKGVRDVTRDSLLEGDEVFETEDNKFIGTINEVTYKAATKDYVAADGSIYIAEIPESYDVMVTVDAKGKKTSSGFYTESDLQILYGKEIEIKTSSVKTKPKVVGIELKNIGE